MLYQILFGLSNNENDEMNKIFYLEYLNGRDYSEDLDMDEKIKSERILGKQGANV
jgi:hypothetical protein